MQRKNKLKLDNFEEKILSSFEANEWKTVKNIHKQKEDTHKIASKTVKKDRVK